MSKKYKIFLAMLFIILFPLIIHGSFESYNFFQDRWFNCLDYLEQGTLYGGQPFCFQGPVAFLTLNILNSFGEHYLNLAITIFSFILVLSIFLLGNKIIKKESGKDNLIIYTLLFCFLFLYFSLGKFACFLGTALFFFAVYILFYTKFKYKLLYTGILFALSIFSKINHVIFIFVILSYYFIYKLNILKEFEYKKLKPLIYFLMPTIIIFILFKIVWPYFFSYVFLIGLLINNFTPTVLPSKAILPQMALSIPQILKDIFTVEPLRIFIWFAIIFSTISFFKKKRAIASITSFGFLLIYIATIVLRPRLYLPSLLFFAIIFTIEFNSMKKKYLKYLLFVFLLLLFLCPALKVLYLDVQLRQIQTLTSSALKELPVPEGKILGDLSLHRLKFYGLNIDKDNYEYVREPGLTVIDPVTKVLEKSDIYKPKEWERDGNKQSDLYKDRILAGNFSLIIYSPRNYLTDIYLILATAKKNNSLFKNYCIYKIPSFERRCIWCEPVTYIILNKNTNMCNLYSQKIINYYQDYFAKICKKSSVAGLLTKLVLIDGGWSQTEGDLVCKYTKESDILIKVFWKKFFLPKPKEIDLTNIKECLIFLLDNKTIESIGKLCNKHEDCKTNEENVLSYTCIKSGLKYLHYPPVICSEKEDCSNFVKHPFRVTDVECNKNLCMIPNHIQVTFAQKGPFVALNDFSINKLNEETVANILNEYTN